MSAALSSARPPGSAKASAPSIERSPHARSGALHAAAVRAASMASRSIDGPMPWRCPGPALLSAATFPASTTSRPSSRRALPGALASRPMPTGRRGGRGRQLGIARQAVKCVAYAMSAGAGAVDRDALTRRTTSRAPQTIARGDVTRPWSRTPHPGGPAAYGGQDHFYLEGQIAIAGARDDGGLHVLSSTRTRPEVQHGVAHLLACRRQGRRRGAAHGGAFGRQGSQATTSRAIAALLPGAPADPSSCGWRATDNMVTTASATISCSTGSRVRRRRSHPGLGCRRRPQRGKRRRPVVVGHDRALVPHRQLLRCADCLQRLSLPDQHGV